MLVAFAKKTFRGLPGEGEQGLVRAGSTFYVEEARFKELLANKLVDPHAGVAPPQFAPVAPVNAVAPVPENKMKPASKPRVRRRRSPT